MKKKIENILGKKVNEKRVILADTCPMGPLDVRSERRTLLIGWAHI